MMKNMIYFTWALILGVAAFIYYTVMGAGESTTTVTLTTPSDSNGSTSQEATTYLGGVIDSIQGEETTTRVGQWIDGLQELFRS